MKKKIAGFSLFELLVVISIFGVISILSTQAVLLALRGARKTDSNTKVRNDIEYSLSIMERHLRTAGRLTACTPTRVDYEDALHTPAYFECVNTGSYIASGSANIHLTSTDTKIYCTNVFTCPSSGPVRVEINLGGSDVKTLGETTPSFTQTAKIYLRN